MRILLTGIWFGLITGFAEVLVHGIKKFLLHTWIFLGPDIIWMAPLADGLLFGCVGLLLLILARWRPRLVSPRVALFVFLLLGLYSLLLFRPSLHWLASLVLAAGLAAQTARYIAARNGSFNALVRRTTVWLVVLVIGLAGGLRGWEAFAESRTLGSLPDPPSAAPSVLLIVLDTVRAQNLGLYGYDRETTPRLRRWARTGVRFSRAVATAPSTQPSHGGMLTGRYPRELFVNPERRLQELNSDVPTLAGVLTANGYVTAGFVANVDFCSYETGLDRGFAHYEDYPVSPAELVHSSSIGRKLVNSGELRRLLGFEDVLGRKRAARVSSDFLEWLDRHARLERRDRHERRPFFAFLNFNDAHQPYLPPAPFDRKFRSGMHRDARSDGASKPRGQLEPSPAELESALAAYDGSIAYLDHEVGALLDALQARGLLGNTLVVVTSDHGEQFGEHGLTQHANSLYRQALQVPLIISSHPRVPAGTTVPEPVSIRDVAATVIDILGIESSSGIGGASLARFWEDRPLDDAGDLLLSELIVPSSHMLAKNHRTSAVMAGYHYVRSGSGREEFYDFDADPAEVQDLAGSESGKPVVRRFRSVLEANGRMP